MIKLHPYLYFNGNCKQAMEFYHSVLGGDLILDTYSSSGNTEDPQNADRIIHAQLTAGSVIIMASDRPVGQDTPFGDNVHLSLVGTDSKTLTEQYTKFTEGGTILLPMAEQFWGDVYGVVTDKFGISWDINISAETK